MKKHLIYSLFFLFSFQIIAQKTEKFDLKKYKIAKLSDSLEETSGLTYFDGRLFSFNDSGNTSEIFEISTKNSKIIKKFQTGLQNIDWEAITNDGKNFYVGEFGNNLGKRKDLKIYQIPFRNNLIIKDSIKTIPFYYPEQKEFNLKNHGHNFDAEAMIYLDGNIHLFTKEWQTNTVSHYLIDKNSTEIQPAKKLESYNTGFVVTDASYYNNQLFMIGYTRKATAYLMIFEKDKNNNLFFSNPILKRKLGKVYNIGQVEGITATEKGLYISGEKFSVKIKKVPQRLYFIPFKDLK